MFTTNYLNIEDIYIWIVLFSVHYYITDNAICVRNIG